MHRVSFTRVSFLAFCAIFGQAGVGRAAPAIGDVSATYASLAAAIYGDAAAKAGELDQAVDKLIAAPSQQTLDAARSAWKAARVPYMQSEGFRFGNKIVDDWEGQVNSWPLDEGLIDYVDTASYGETKEQNPLYTANVIANTKIRLGSKVLDTTKITKELIAQFDGAMDVEANVGTGYHAIEFLLWGQDLHGTGPGAGERPATDFDTKNCTHKNCDRRGAYLKAATSLLVDDLRIMTGNWKNDGAARAAFLAQAPEAQLATILKGLGSLSYGELAGERMKLGVLLHDTEEEQDCFSDDTHNSLYYDQIGILSLWNGKYDGPSAVKGPGLAELARAAAPDVAKRVDDAMALTLARLKSIKDKADSGAMAYDQMLASGNDDGNKLITDGVEAFVSQARALEAVVTALKLPVTFEGSDSLDNPAAVVSK